MKHIKLTVAEEIKHILPSTLKKDLNDNEIICPACHGLGVVKRKNPFGLKEKEDNYYSKINWYDNESLTFCPDCYNGIVSLCEYCGKPIQKGYINKCDCDQYKKIESENKKSKYQETINKAKEVAPEAVKTYLYDENSNRYFSDIDDFIEYYLSEYDANEIDEVLPNLLWVCSESEISLDAEDIVEQACEDLHEDAFENCDYGELQGMLNDWCSKQSGTTTYYPCYKEYVIVNKEWFNQ